MYEYDSSDALGAGSYPSPLEEEEQLVTGEVTVTYQIYDYVPKNWDIDQIEDDIKENLYEYIDIREFKDIEIDI